MASGCTHFLVFVIAFSQNVIACIFERERDSFEEKFFTWANMGQSEGVVSDNDPRRDVLSQERLKISYNRRRFASFSRVTRWYSPEESPDKVIHPDKGIHWPTLSLLVNMYSSVVLDTCLNTVRTL